MDISMNLLLSKSIFDFKPVDRSSMIVTSCPSEIKASAKFEPINPAPPVIATLFFTVILYRNSNRVKEKSNGFQ
jgi:hypothetical protein